MEDNACMTPSCINDQSDQSHVVNDSAPPDVIWQRGPFAEVPAAAAHCIRGHSSKRTVLKLQVHSSSTEIGTRA